MDLISYALSRNFTSESLTSAGGVAVTETLKGGMPGQVLIKNTDGDYDFSWREEESVGGGSIGGIQLAPPTNVTLTNADEAVIIKWTDPENLMLNGGTIAEWSGTIVIRKIGSAPADRTDGVVVVDSKIRSQYAEDGFTDSNLTNGETYHYGIFPYTTARAYTYSRTDSIMPQEIYPSVPTGVSVSGGNAQATVTFVKPDDAPGIRIVYKAGSAPENEADGTIVETTQSPHTITGLTNDTEYFVRVYAHSSKRFAGADAVSVTPRALPITTWADGSWEDIERMLEAHYNGDIDIEDYWSVGDTKTVQLAEMPATYVSENHAQQITEFVIIGFNHDELNGGAIGNKVIAAVTIQQKDCLNEKGGMNSTDTNTGGWFQSTRRKWCNEVYIAALPEGLRRMLKKVFKRTTIGNMDSYVSGAEDKVFLLSEIEVTNDTARSFAGEGRQYEYYKTASNRIKKINNSNYYWTLRSPSRSATSFFCSVNTAGNVISGYATSAYGIAPAMAI